MSVTQYRSKKPISNLGIKEICYTISALLNMKGGQMGLLWFRFEINSRPYSLRLCPNTSPTIIRNLSLYLKLIHACIAYFWKVIANHVKYFGSILRAIGPNPRMCHLRAQTKNYAHTQSLLPCYLYVLTLSINIFASLFVLFYLSLSQKF